MVLLEMYAAKTEDVIIDFTDCLQRGKEQLLRINFFEIEINLCPEKIAVQIAWTQWKTFHAVRR